MARTGDDAIEQVSNLQAITPSARLEPGGGSRVDVLTRVTQIGVLIESSRTSEFCSSPLSFLVTRWTTTTDRVGRPSRCGKPHPEHFSFLCIRM